MSCDTCRYEYNFYCDVETCAVCDACLHNEDDVHEVRMVDRGGDRTEGLCHDCAHCCSGCGESGAQIQPLDEWIGWLYCPACFTKRVETEEFYDLPRVTRADGTMSLWDEVKGVWTP